MGMYSHDDMEWAREESSREQSIIENINLLAKFANKPEREIKNSIVKHIREQIITSGGFSLTPYGSYCSAVTITSYSDIVLEILKSSMSDEEKKCLELYIYWVKNSLPPTPLIRRCVLVLDYEQIAKGWFSKCCTSGYVTQREYLSKLQEEKQAFLEYIKNQSLESLISEMREA